ncbi:flavin-containing monooxygenase [Moritella yayanosii]|uniref:FAD dependent oxidoreductase n=1 Tax=Moritella yayanosii TaxID=69539 RepID=A0A330LNI1_9GAMM|nr:NAD(P)/FAD-dependent oxidoreductase [Moritella yayanosii]SQD78012.1 FAD dependent oxidoreductase [Moritella yayanosii]
MSTLYDVVIIGAGQSGLSVSYYLTQQKINHLVIEKDNVLASSWRNRKWDSFTLVTPNSMNQLPNFPCSQFNDDAFLNKEQVCQYIEDFAASFNAPVKFGITVTNVSKNDDGVFEVITSNDTLLCKQVVVATSTFNQPSIPSVALDIPDSVLQLHSSSYKNPESLPQGSVLVVGTAQSGAQITQELVEYGYKVFCTTSKVPKSQRRYRGKDISLWARLIGLLDKKSASLKDLNGRFPASPQITGKDGGSTIHLPVLMNQGLVLLGRLIDVSNGRLIFSDDVVENMKFNEAAYVDWKDKIDQYILDTNIDASESDYIEPPSADYSNAPTSIHIQEDKINTIIWATGYRFDYSWINENVFDEYGYPDTNRGITTCDGLCFVGLNNIDLNKTGLLYGTGEHAKYIAEHIITALETQSLAAQLN